MTLTIPAEDRTPESRPLWSKPLGSGVRRNDERLIVLLLGFVIPAKAGIQWRALGRTVSWIPAYAGMTDSYLRRLRQSASRS